MGVVKGIENFEGRSSFKTWLYRILINRVAVLPAPESIATRRASRIMPSTRSASTATGNGPTRWSLGTRMPDDRLDAATWGPILQSGLEDLPARQRQVVVLRDIDGLSADEVCDLLGLSAGNQRILLHRGRTRLREILESQIAKA